MTDLGNLSVVVSSPYGIVTPAGLEIIRSWAETWVSAWWWAQGQGSVYSMVSADAVYVVTDPELIDHLTGYGRYQLNYRP